MGHRERIRDIFDYVAFNREFRIDLRRFLDTAGLDFKDKRVLDAGCGQGLAACYLASAKGARSVLGFDMSPASITEANRLKAETSARNAVFEVSEIETFRSDRRFDVVCCFGVLQYVEDFFACLDELCGRLDETPEATLVFTMTEPTLLSQAGLLAQMVTSRLPTRCVPGGVKAVSFLLKPFHLNAPYAVKGAENERELARPLENLVRETIFSPIYNLVRSAQAAAFLESRGFSAEVSPFLSIKGMYTIKARRRPPKERGPLP